eukprot:jgi/Tetstr1/461033/TSEL_006183.t1
MATEPAAALAHPTVTAAPSQHSVNVRRGCPRGPACHRSSPRRHRAARGAALLLKAARADPPATAALPAGIALPAVLPCCRRCVPVLAADRVLLPGPRCALLAMLTPLLWLAALAAGCPRGPACHRSSPRRHRAARGAALLMKAARADPPATAALPAGIALPAALPCC